jgi:2-polyprenyl-3-methyl-5-hydroxy-6-metoxy-1,4-benzoquinol methylase
MEQQDQHMNDLTKRETHFEFGQNWKAYATTIDKVRIDSAIDGLKKLFPDGLSGKTFLDIGCGSGLHSLAALSLGASSVLATDIDENSVSTTRQLLSQHFPDSDRWTAKVVSVFDMTPETLGKFDVVYSWGVLHHTGAMWRAIETAAKLVKPDGQFAIAIYGKTPMDAAWKIEKRIYSGAPKALQWVIRQAYIGAVFTAQGLRGRNPVSDARVRGMNFSHDVHDWLGGYPYETASVDELQDRICALGFSAKRSFPIAISLGGFFSSGCHEIVFQRDAANAG